MIKFLLLFFTVTSISPTHAKDEFKYTPVDEDFWIDVKSELDDKDFVGALSISQEQFELADSGDSVAAEAKLVAALSLTELGYSFGATSLLSDLITNKSGSSVAIQSLKTIDSIAGRFPTNEDELKRIMVLNVDFEPLPPEALSITGYFRGLSAREKGYIKWAAQEFSKIKRGSFWDYKFRYRLAAERVSGASLPKALETFGKLALGNGVPETIKNDAAHQYARLLFEKKDFTRAYAFFEKVKLNPRERGRLLLERAWTKYYLRDYSKALGLLSALDAPVFQTSVTPESYILKMIILTELCHFEAVQDTFKQFMSQYGDSFTAIRNKDDLRKNQRLVNIALLDQSLGRTVEYLALLKKELSLLLNSEFENFFFYETLKINYTTEIKRITDELDYSLLEAARKTADDLLNWKEELNFLDYQAKLEGLKVAQSGKVTKDVDIPNTNFDQFYWVNQGEYWIDELEDFRSFIQSKCPGRGTRPK